MLRIKRTRPAKLVEGFTMPNGMRKPDAPKNWPFGVLPPPVYHPIRKIPRKPS